MAYDVSSVAMFYVQVSYLEIDYFLLPLSESSDAFNCVPYYWGSYFKVDQIIPWDGSSNRGLLAKGSTGRGDENLLFRCSLVRW